MDKEKMLTDVMAKDFMVIDLQLYMDTHHDDKQALIAYNEAVKTANEARSAYEKQFGPLSRRSVTAESGYNWITPEWPWQSEYMQ